MEDKIEEHFSCNRWLLVKSNKISDFINYFNLVEDKIKLIEWKNYDHYYGSNTDAPMSKNKLIITSNIDDYCIIEGSLLDQYHKEYCLFFSQQQSIVYDFGIDIWIPIMNFNYYQDKKLIRSYECTLDIDNQEVAEEEYGKKLDVEENVIIPTPSQGYDYFFYPLGIMNNLGITQDKLLKSMHAVCRTFTEPV